MTTLLIPATRRMIPATRKTAGLFALVLVPGLLATPGTAAAQAAKPGTVTFSKEIAPILQRSCQNCHRPGAIAPMSLMTYEAARPWASSIKQRVVARAMPPWFIDKTAGIQRFKEDKSLSDQEIATIAAWVDGGAPRGNPADMPPPRQFADARSWNIGEPDLIVSLAVPFVVPAEGPDAWVDLVNDTGLTEDRWIKAMETKPSAEGFPAVHHSSTYYFTESAYGDTEIRLGQYALGKYADIFPDGTGRLLKAGSKIRFNMHYHSVGEELADSTSIAFKFYPKGYVPKRQLLMQHVGDVQDLDLPRGESNIRHDGYMTLDKNVQLTVFQPHLHSRGKRQCLEAIYANGQVETLNCANWDFGWHIPYTYEDDVQPLLPKGTVLHVISWHDNSSANKWNPDPKNWVGFGNRSTDDMSFAWLSWYVLTDEEYLAASKVRQRPATTATR